MDLYPGLSTYNGQKGRQFRSSEKWVVGKEKAKHEISSRLTYLGIVSGSGWFRFPANLVESCRGLQTEGQRTGWPWVCLRLEAHHTRTSPPWARLSESTGTTFILSVDSDARYTHGGPNIKLEPRYLIVRRR